MVEDKIIPFYDNETKIVEALKHMHYYKKK